MNRALLKSENNHHNTPLNFMEYVYSFWPRGVDLDPCSNSSSIVKAKTKWDGTFGQCGLSIQWVGRVFCNPPYKNEIPKWVKKCVESSYLCECEIILLVPSRTDTRWFNMALEACDSLCLVKGRLKFGEATNAAPFPSAVFYWGDKAEACGAIRTAHGV
jgi:hypothetical protein